MLHIQRKKKKKDKIIENVTKNLVLEGVQILSLNEARIMSTLL